MINDESALTTESALLLSPVATIPTLYPVLSAIVEKSVAVTVLEVPDRPETVCKRVVPSAA